MPRFRQVEKNPTLISPVSSPGAPRVSRDAAGAGGEVMQNLGRSMSELGKSMLDTYQTAVGNERLSQATAELQQYAQDLHKGHLDADGKLKTYAPEKHMELYAQSRDAILEKYSRNLSGKALQILTYGYNDLASRQGLQVQANSLDLMKDRTRAALDSSITSDATNFVNAESQLTKNSIQESVFKKLREAEANFVITPQQALALRHRFVDDSGTGTFLKMMRKDPDSAAKAIQLGEFVEMDADKQQRLLSLAVAESERRDRRANTERERLRVQQEREEKEQKEWTAKEMTKLLYAGTLTPEFVESQSEHLTTDEFKFFMKKSRGASEEAVTDIGVYSDLRIRAARGEDVRQEAAQRGRELKLTVDNYNSISSLVEASPQIKALNWVSRGEKYLSTVLAPDKETATGFDKQVMAEGLESWIRWAQAHPNATDEEAHSEYIRIAESLWIVDKRNLRITTPTPRFAVGGKASVTAESMASIWAATKKAYADKKIDKDEFEAQGAIIERWQKIFKKENAIETEKKAAGNQRFK